MTRTFTIEDAWNRVHKDTQQRVYNRVWDPTVLDVIDHLLLRRAQAQRELESVKTEILGLRYYELDRLPRLQEQQGFLESVILYTDMELDRADRLRAECEEES